LANGGLHGRSSLKLRAGAEGGHPPFSSATGRFLFPGPKQRFDPILWIDPQHFANIHLSRQRPEIAQSIAGSIFGLAKKIKRKYHSQS
jgi:hypothetical protein